MPTASRRLRRAKCHISDRLFMPFMNGADFIRACRASKNKSFLNAKQAEQCIDSIADEAVDDGLTGGHGSGFGCVCHVSFSMICR